MDNMQFFNRITLTLFKRLHESFPIPENIETCELVAEVIPEDTTQVAVQYFLETASECLLFLEAEKFLAIQGQYRGGTNFEGVRLTLKGLAILSSVPGSLQEGTSLIERIKKALAGGAKEASSEIVKLVAQQTYAAAAALVPIVIA